MNKLVKNIKPRGVNQIRYVELLTAQKPHIVVATGASGSGKTLIATHIGCQKLYSGEVEKLVITRPTVSVGPDDLGFLPGTLHQKMEPWVKPVYDALMMHYPKTKIVQMVDEGKIEIASLSHMRGRTLSQSWIICDEAQNTTIDQMLMVLTRIGQGSKLVITGDPMQHDRTMSINGLSDLLHRCNRFTPRDDIFQIVQFDVNDVQRHPAIPVVLDIYSPI